MSLFNVIVCVWCCLCWAAVGCHIVDKILNKNRKLKDTEVGVSAITHKAMREHKALELQDNNITADYVPVAPNKSPVAYIILVVVMMFLGVFGHRIGQSIYDNLRYQSHVERICERVSPTKRGYHHNRTSDHKLLIDKHGPKVPKTLRVMHGKELCGHD